MTQAYYQGVFTPQQAALLPMPTFRRMPELSRIPLAASRAPPQAQDWPLPEEKPQAPSRHVPLAGFHFFNRHAILGALTSFQVGVFGFLIGYGIAGFEAGFLGWLLGSSFGLLAGTLVAR